MSELEPMGAINSADLPDMSGVWPQSRSKLNFDLNRDWPRISIVTPSFNQAPFLEKTIRSVLLQQYPNLQFIIIDGGSQDASVGIIKRYSRWLDYWVSEEDKGQSDALNKGFSLADGEILGWLNSDDYLLPDALFYIAEGFKNNSEALAIVGRGHKVNERGKRIYSPWPGEINTSTLLRWMEGGNFMQPACFFSRAAWTSCGPLDLNRKYCMDVELWLRIAGQGAIAAIEADIAHAHEHAMAKTTANVGSVMVETASLIKSFGGEQEADRALHRLGEYCDHMLQREIELQSHPFTTLLKRVAIYLSKRTRRVLKL